MKTAIAYARYSSDNQREESIDAQLRAIKEYAYKNDYEIVRNFIDEAKSGRSDNRPAFQEIFEYIKYNKCDVLIVHKLDRFARSRMDSAIYKHKLKEKGLKLISVLENIDGSPESIILESVMEGLSEYYSANLAREVMKGLRENAYQCRHTGGVPPLGYDVEQDGKYIINEKEAALVRRIFEMYNLGKSYREIADILNSEGQKSKVGKRFTKHSFNDMLQNEKYKGIYIFNKTAAKAPNGTRNYHKTKSSEDIIRIESGMPEIVNHALWSEVNRKMTTNKRPGEKKANRVYLLSGLVHCGECGSPMSGNTRKSGRNKTEYSTYDCNARKREKTCTAKSVNCAYVENLTLDYLVNDFFTEENVEELTMKIERVAKDVLDEADRELPVLKKELKELNIEKEKIIDAMINNEGTSEWLGKRAAEVKSRIEYLEDGITFYENKQKAKVLNHKKIKDALLMNRDVKNISPEGQKATIRTYVERVTVFHNHVDFHMFVDFNGEGDGN